MNCDTDNMSVNFGLIVGRLEQQMQVTNKGCVICFSICELSHCLGWGEEVPVFCLWFLHQVRRGS